MSLISSVTELLAAEGIESVPDEPMKKHTSFKIGGNCDLFVLPKNESQVKRAMQIAKEKAVPVTVLGNGSNMLVSDRGIEGIVLCLEKLCGITVSGNTVTAECGALLSRFASVCAANSLSGAEFAAGIPGSVGGAVYMNAGAYGGEIKNIVKSVTALKDGEITEISAEKCGFGYRKSIFTGGEYVILSAQFVLENGVESEIRAVMRDLAQRRREKQPIEMPSAGSTFKRPEGHYAGGLIEGSGLKGYSVGGAKVSEKHAGFVVNFDNASCDDVLKLIEYIKAKVYADSGVMLEEEVRVIGRR